MVLTYYDDYLRCRKVTCIKQRLAKHLKSLARQLANNEITLEHAWQQLNQIISDLSPFLDDEKEEAGSSGAV